MAFSNLTKASSQLTPYFWMWGTNTKGSVAGKRMGTTLFYLSAPDDTALLARINGHEGYLDKASVPTHGK